MSGRTYECLTKDVGLLLDVVNVLRTQLLPDLLFINEKREDVSFLRRVGKFVVLQKGTYKQAKCRSFIKQGSFPTN